MLKCAVASKNSCCKLFIFDEPTLVHDSKSSHWMIRFGSGSCHANISLEGRHWTDHRKQPSRALSHQ